MEHLYSRKTIGQKMEKSFLSLLIGSISKYLVLLKFRFYCLFDFHRGPVIQYGEVQITIDQKLELVNTRRCVICEEDFSLPTDRISLEKR